MKIVFLNHFISGGGAERVTCLLAGRMAESGHEVILMTDLFRPFAYTFDERVRKIPLFTSEKESRSHVYFLYMVRNVRTMIKDEQPDIIVGVLPVMSMVAIIASYGTKTKVIASHHTSFDRREGWHIRFIKDYAYRFADAVTILTQADYNYLGSRLPKKVVMPNPLAYPCVKDVTNPRKKNILAVGRLDVWKIKGFDILIEAWGKIAKDFPEWSLDIAGKGKNESLVQLRNIAEANGVFSRINFLGFRKDIDAVMRESSIFVLSSRIEGFGMVLIEAMSQGCACISFDDGGRQSEIIRNDSEGIIVDRHNADDLADSMRAMITNEPRRREIALRGLDRVNNYNIEKTAKRWESLFEKILEK